MRRYCLRDPPPPDGAAGAAGAGPAVERAPPPELMPLPPIAGEYEPPDDIDGAGGFPRWIEDAIDSDKVIAPGLLVCGAFK